MIETVDNALVGPRICDRVETRIAEMAGVDFSDERKGAVKMGVPRYRTSSDKRNRSESRARAGQSLVVKNSA